MILWWKYCVIGLRIETNLRCIRNDVEIAPIDVPVQMTFMQLLNVVYDIFGVDKESKLI